MGQGKLLKNPQPETNNIVLPSGGTADRPEAPSVGSFRFNTDNGQAEVFNGNTFTTLANAGGGSFDIDSFTGDGSTLTFGAMTYEPAGVESILVFVGSVYQASDSYTVLSDDITFIEAPPNGLSIHIVHITA